MHYINPVCCYQGSGSSWSGSDPRAKKTGTGSNWIRYTLYIFLELKLNIKVNIFVKVVLYNIFGSGSDLFLWNHGTDKLGNIWFHWIQTLRLEIYMKLYTKYFLSPLCYLLFNFGLMPLIIINYWHKSSVQKIPEECSFEGEKSKSSEERTIRKKR